MNNRLYKEFASYYAAVTNDRDFKGQLELILSTYASENPCQSFLELFAGQSLHSIEALKKTDIEVWAMDASSEMRHLALAEGFSNPNQYIVGELPGSLVNYTDKVKFDCITCLYNGLSNLTKAAVFELLKNVRQLLTSKGKLFIEMHNIYYIMEYIANPQIQYTEVKNTKGELINYAWPSGKIKWNPYSYIAEVPVKFIIQSSQRTDTIEFTSTDHIYSTEDIIFLANLVDYECKVLTADPLWSNTFEKAVVLELSLK